MSLKGFHIVFITLSVLCTFGFAFWTFLSDAETNTGAVRGLGIFSAVAGAVLLVYGIWFYRNNFKNAPAQV